ncbi:MAG TPA: DUF4339 domain-containing protein [Verrucomicrobiae bacterium]|nr:DUF4339 domain-containing protein [Verrucomicrobiae bacterium]
METTYKILGGDGKEYGPATLEQMLGWIRDGRVSAATQVWRNDQNAWVTAGQLPELQLSAPPPPVAPPGASAFPIDRMHLVSRMRSGGSWFYWIAGLSLINSISAFTGSGWGFIVGLGITRLVDRFADTRILALVVDIVIAGVFVLLGVFANRAQLWAFIVGMVVYALDGLIFAKSGAWLNTAFHVFVLIALFNGFRAARQLRMSA